MAGRTVLRRLQHRGSSTVDDHRLLELGLANGTLLDYVRDGRLDISRAVNYCLLQLTQLLRDGSHTAVSCAASAAGGLEQLMADPQLGALVERRRVVDVLEEGVRRLIRQQQQPPVQGVGTENVPLAAGLRVMLRVLLKAALDSECASRYADQVNSVRLLCADLVLAGASPAPPIPDESHCLPDRLENANAPPMPLSLAALSTLREPGLAVLLQQQPGKRPDLAAAVAALLVRLHQDLLLQAPSPAQNPDGDSLGVSQLERQEAAGAGPHGAAACHGGSAHSDLEACLEVLADLLRAYGALGHAVHGAAVAAAVGTPGFMGALAALLRPASDWAAATGLTSLQQLALNCFSCTVSSGAAEAAPEACVLAREQAIEAGAGETLVKLLRTAGDPERVLQLLLTLARKQQVNSHSYPGTQRVVRALAEACAACGETQTRFLAAAASAIRQADAAPPGASDAPNHRLLLLLEVGAALLLARPEAAPSLHGHPLEGHAVGCLAGEQGDSAAGGPLPAEQHAALRLLHPLLCSYPQGRPLPVGEPGPLLRGLARQAAAGNGDGSDGNNSGAACGSCTRALGCLYHCLRLMGATVAQQHLLGLGSDVMAQLVHSLSGAIATVQQQQQASCPNAASSATTCCSALPLPLLQLAACVLEAGCELARDPQADLAPFSRLAAAVALSPAVTALLPSLMHEARSAVPDSNTPCWLPYGGSSKGGSTPGLLALWAVRAAVCLATQQHQTAEWCSALADVLMPAVAPLLRLPEREGGAWALQLLLMFGVVLEEEADQHGAIGTGSGCPLARAVAAEAGHCSGLWRRVLPASSALLQQLAAPGGDMSGLGQGSLRGDGEGDPADRCCLGVRHRRTPAATVQLLHACATLLNGPDGEGKAAQAALLGPAVAPGVVATALRVLQGGVEGAEGPEGEQLQASALAVLRPLAPQLPRDQAAELLTALAERAGVEAGAGGAGHPAVLLCLAACQDNHTLQADDWQALGLRSLYAFCGAVTMHLEEGNQPTDVPLTAEENPPPPLVDVRSLLCLACHLLRLGCSKGDSEDLPAPMAGDEARVPLLCLARASLRAALSLTQQPAPPLVPWPDISCLMWYDLADCLLAAVHTVEGDTSMASGAVAAAGTGRLADGSGGSGSSSLAQSLTTTAAHGQLLVEVVVLVGQATAALSGRLQQLQQLGAQDSVEVAGEGEAASAKERPSLLAAVAAATRLQAWATAAMHKELVAAWAQVQRAEEEGKAQVQRAVEEGRAQLQRAKEEGRAQVQRTEQDAQAEAAQLQERLTGLQATSARLERHLAAARVEAAEARRQLALPRQRQPCVTASTDAELGLLRACTDRDAGGSAVRRMLNETPGLSPNTQNNLGKTALYLAANANKLDVVMALLEAGADTEAPNTAGMTPLMVAACHDFKDVARVLLAAGANKEAFESKGNTPLLLAAERGHAGVTAVLLAAGANKSSGNKNGDTALHRAAFGGFADVVEMLLRAGANKKATNDKGRTPRQMAKKAEHINVEYLLREVKGAY